MLADVLQTAYCIVSKITHCSGSEWRYSRDNRRAMLAELLFDDFEYVAFDDLPFFSVEHRDFFTLSPDLHIRMSAEEGIAADLLSAFN